MRDDTGPVGRNGVHLVRYFHMVLTVPHAPGEPLQDTWDRLDACRSAFKHNRWLSTHADAYRLRTHVTWSEATGFGPHDHYVLGQASSFPEIDRLRAAADRRWRKAAASVGVEVAPIFYESRPLDRLRGYVLQDHFKRRYRGECEEGLQVGHLAARASTGEVEDFERWEELEAAAQGRTWTSVGGAWFNQPPQEATAEG